MKKVLIIYNPTSGSAAGPELWLGSVVHRLCLDAGTVTVVSTTHGTTPENILPEDINPRNTDLIVAAGGDGTVRMVLHCLASRQLPIPAGIIPLGTGNLLARNLKIYEETLLVDPIEKAIDILLKGSPMAIDLGIMNGQYFAAAAGAGPLSDAIITPDRRDKENWKMLAYAGSMVQTLGKAPVLFRIEADGEVFKISATGIFVTNIADLGVGSLSETASMNDGLLDLCILSPREFSDYLKYGFHFAASASAITAGKAPYYVRKVRDLTISVVKRMRPLSILEAGLNEITNKLMGKGASRTVGQNVTAMIDGDAWGNTPMQIGIAPLAVRVIVPPQALRSQA